MSWRHGEDLRTRGPVQRGQRLANFLMSSDGADRGPGRPPARPIANVGDPVTEDDGFGADALPLRPAIERSEEQEREERLRLLEGRRRRLRLPSTSRRTVVVALMFGSCAVLIGLLLSHPWHGHEVGADPAAAVPHRIEAPKTIDRGHALVTRRPIDEAAASDRGRRASAHPVARHQKRDSHLRSNKRHRESERSGKTAQVPAAASEAGPSAAPAPAAAESSASPEPTPVSEPPPTPTPATQQEVTKAPAQPTSSPADETAASHGPTSVQQEFGFER